MKSSRILHNILDSAVYHTTRKRLQRVAHSWKNDFGRAPRVAVGLSGGVDSSTTAYILQHSGFDVEGVFMRNWDPAEESELGETVCPIEQDYLSAKSVAEHLDIPIRRVDFADEYWTRVFEPFLEAYAQGLTPNPDAGCNVHIKFGAMRQNCLDHGADFVATGHYVGIETTDEQGFPRVCDVYFLGGGEREKQPKSIDVYFLGGDERKKQPPKNIYIHTHLAQLRRAVDELKDQSLFLCTVPREQLKNVLFPLELLHKEEVRRIATAVGLPNATRRDSYGICFVGKRKMEDFLPRYLEMESGPIRMLESGEVVGEHGGLALFTEGQNARVGGMPKKLYVVRKDVSRNTLWVVDDWWHPALFSGSWTMQIQAGEHAFLECTQPQTITYRLRHSQLQVGKAQATVVQPGIVHIESDLPQRGISPGQTAAIYDEHSIYVLAGGPVLQVGQSDYEKQLQN